MATAIQADTTTKEDRAEATRADTKITPLKAIRLKCVDCSGFQTKEVRECKFKDCPLYPLRMGRGSRATLKKIRAFCLWCCNNQNNEVRLCSSVKCSLWEYRFGKRPKKLILHSKILTTAGGTEASRV